MLLAAVNETPPPASLMTMLLVPRGLTNTMSTSSGKRWLKPLSFSVTLLTFPTRPDTLINDG